MLTSAFPWPVFTGESAVPLSRLESWSHESDVSSSSVLEPHDEPRAEQDDDDDEDDDEGGDSEGGGDREGEGADEDDARVDDVNASAADDERAVVMATVDDDDGGATAWWIGRGGSGGSAPPVDAPQLLVVMVVELLEEQDEEPTPAMSPTSLPLSSCLPAALAACRMMGVAVERMVGGLLGGGGGAWGFAGVWEECRSAVWACAEAVAAVEAGAACRNTWCRMGVA